MTQNPQNKTRSSQNWTYLTATSIYLLALLLVSGCAYDPKKLTPHFIDATNNTTREYHVVETTPEIKFEYTRTNTLKDAVENNGGLMCLPVPQALEIKRKYQSHARRSNKATEPQYLEFEAEARKQVPRTIEEELEILNDIPAWSK